MHSEQMLEMWEQIFQIVHHLPNTYSPTQIFHIEYIHMIYESISMDISLEGIRLIHGDVWMYLALLSVHMEMEIGESLGLIHRIGITIQVQEDLS